MDFEGGIFEGEGIKVSDGLVLVVVGWLVFRVSVLDVVR